jgi:cell division protein FtsL
MKRPLTWNDNNRDITTEIKKDDLTTNLDTTSPSKLRTLSKTKTKAAQHDPKAMTTMNITVKKKGGESSRMRQHQHQHHRSSLSKLEKIIISSLVVLGFCFICALVLTATTTTTLTMTNYDHSSSFIIRPTTAVVDRMIPAAAMTARENTEDLNTVLSAATQIETVQAELKELNSNIKELTNIMKKQQPGQVR